MFSKSVQHLPTISLILESISVCLILCNFENMCFQTDLFIIMVSQLILQDGFFLVQVKLNSNTSVHPFSLPYNAYATVSCVIASLFLYTAVAHTTYLIASICGTFAATTHFGMAYDVATRTLAVDLSATEKQNEDKED